MWDTAGQETYQSITAPYFRSCNGVILVFDLTDRESFTKLGYWIDLIRDNTKETPIIFLVGNKVDVGQQSVTDAEVASFCSEHSFVFFKTSAVNGENVDEVVDRMIQQMVAESHVRRESLHGVSIQAQEERSKGCC
ncbi:GTP-binding protein YPT1 [Tritrichomonas foetus]|uniref:GTP-binding protein YPT1 n=1 Tax=Tritrichomonas foetus TaxID=1144522 RepID=A0A1J4JDK6_9EUKA|nr:GTP-binding protein YPT1 [Tritrichomonas foetus]|eukprot:OHS96737.1 GTP-binding protein YPT1 [Tritrichomonas foetus]